MKYKCIVEYDYPVDHKTPFEAILYLHGDSVQTDRVKPFNDKEWFPCSERLPKTSKWRTDFLVTTSGGSVLTMEWENTSVRGKEVSRWVWHDRVNFPWEIIAWMELPEPWKERSDGK